MRKRPVGISILAVLSLVGGIGILILQFVFFDLLQEGFSQIGVSKNASVVNISILGGWAIAGGVGLWFGKNWGWWLGVLYLSYSVLRNAYATVAISDLVSQFPEQNINATKYYVTHGLRVVVHSLIVLYYFRENVLDYFGLESSNKSTLFKQMAGATAVLYGLMLLVSKI